MPFINGRYHVNPIMGQALEAAREAEAALLALQQQASRDSGDPSAGASPNDATDPDDPSVADASAGPGPIHRVEIEATEVVPSHSGRAVRGFVARVHRSAGVVAPASSSANFRSINGNERRQRGAGGTQPSSTFSSAAPETHVFADHRDLANFLRDALATSSSQR